MSTIRNKGCFCLNTYVFKFLIKCFSLATRNYIVLFTMKDDDWRIFLVNICCHTQTTIFIGFF